MATFGYTTTPTGGARRYSNESSGDTKIVGSVFTLSESGLASKITAYISSDYGSYKAKCAIYRHSDLSLVAVTNEIDNTYYQEWVDFTFSTGVNLTADDYVLVITGSDDDYAEIYYDTGSANQGHNKNQPYGTFPNPLVSPTHNTEKYGIYVTYTPTSTAAYTALPITVTVPATTAGVEEEDTAAISPLGVTATIPAITASSVELRTAAYSASSVVLTVPSVTATSIEERAAAFTPISVQLAIPNMTAASVEERTAAYSALSVLMVTPYTTGTYVEEVATTFDPVSMTVTIPSITASREEKLSAVIDPLSVLATIPSVTATSESELSANYPSLIITMTPPAMTASYIAELAAAYNPLSMIVTPIDSTPSVIENRTYINFGTKIEYYVEGQLVEDVG
jgi:hypothetical protein